MYHTELSVNQTRLLSSSENWPRGTEREREGSLTKVDTMAFALLHVAYFYLQACWGLILYIPLPLDDGVLLYLHNFMSQLLSHNTRLMMGSSVFMVIWWSIDQCVASEGPLAGQKLFLKRRIVIFRNGRALSQILSSCALIHLYRDLSKLQTSLSATGTSSTIGSAGSYCPSGRTWTCDIVFSCSAYHSKLVVFWVTQQICLSITPKWRICFF